MNIKDEIKGAKFNLVRWLRNRIFTGIIIALPLIATIAGISWIVQLIDNNVLKILPRTLNPNTYLGFNIPVLGEFPNIRMNTVDHIEIVKFVEQQIIKFQPNRIFTHHPSDLNDDHFHTAKACLPAARLFQRRTDIRPLDAIYFMEILSSTDWSFPMEKKKFEPDTFIDISQTHEVKLQALSKYKDVMRPSPHPRSTDVLNGHARVRGSQCGYEYAEAFQSVFKRGI